MAFGWNTNCQDQGLITITKSICDNKDSIVFLNKVQAIPHEFPLRWHVRTYIDNSPRASVSSSGTKHTHQTCPDENMLFLRFLTHDL